METINRTGKTLYEDLIPIKISVSTLNARLLELTNFGLIKQFAIRNAKQKKEWYEITEKGKTILEILEQLAQLIEK